MSAVYRAVFRHVLAPVDAETAHRLGFGALRAVAAVPGLAERVHRRLVPGPDAGLGVRVLGLDLSGPLGVAAGFDKDAKGVDALGMLGFSLVEVGTVTARAQPGNPRPRLFRLLRDDALLNRMGFNNDGAAAVARRLRRRAARPHLPVAVGVNIGRTRAAAEHETVADYVDSTRVLAPVADYLVVNVSSPNTPGLRDLQAVSALRPLLVAVREAADRAAGRHVPLLVKIAPDLDDADVLAVADLALDLGLDGIVATNTTIARDGLRTPAGELDVLGAGGVSGAPLAARSTEVLRLLRDRVGDRLVLVSAGGVRDAADAHGRLAAGASIVQAYTGFVYGGALWPKAVLRGLALPRPAAAAPVGGRTR